MWLLLLEAVGAMMVLVFIVWWTMFSGRPAESDEAERKLPAADDSPR